MYSPPRAGASTGTPFVLVHGFGANSYQWRYQLPALAEAGHPTYALCLLGYGWSAKPVTEYSVELWGRLVAAFTQEVVGGPALLAGNSVGAIAALSACYERPDLVAGLALLNAAGTLEDGAAEARSADEAGALAALREAAQRVVVQLIFWWTQVRIKLILDQVYVDRSKVDPPLVKSIFRASAEPGAHAAFYEISRAGSRSRRGLRLMLDAARSAGKPLALVWGQKDPWMKPAKALAIQAAYPGALLMPLAEGGHCPMDDCPEETNAALLQWAAGL